MMDKILNGLLDSTLQRLTLAMTAAGIPMIISSCWLGASYQQTAWGLDFIGVLARLFFAPTIAGALCILAFIYPLERLIIRDQARNSAQRFRWIAARFALFFAAGIPIATGIVLSMRVVGLVYPPIIESSYFVNSLLVVTITAGAYTLIESGLEQVKRREAGFKQTIDQLHIQIDEIKRQKDVNDIVDNESFGELRARAQALKARHVESSTDTSPA